MVLELKKSQHAPHTHVDSQCAKIDAPTVAWDPDQGLPEEPGDFLLHSDVASEEDSDREPGSAPTADPDFVADPLIGQRLGDYRIAERIGSGGMARVYLARDECLKRHVALKIIQNRRFVSRESQAKLLEAEAIAQACLQHPNVVSIYHVGEHQGQPFLAMEFVDGESLENRLRSGPLAFVQVLDFARQITRGLAAAYRQGLAHGDIKPANLLIDDDGNLKLSDFGLARHVQRHPFFDSSGEDPDNFEAASQGRIRSDLEESIANREGPLIGTPQYMAPELFSGQAIDERSDLFSTGVTLFQMTFGRFPWQLFGETAQEVRSCLESSEIDFPDDWPDDVPLVWQKILARLLAKNPDDRYASFDALLEDLKCLDPRNRRARSVPRISGLLVDNAILLFMMLPLMISLIRGQSFHSGWIPQYLAPLTLAGPIALLGLIAIWQRSPGDLMAGIRVDNCLTENRKRILPFSYQLIQLLPAIFAGAGVCAMRWLGAQFMICLVSLAAAIAICLVLDILIHKVRHSRLEQICQVQVVVDLPGFQAE